MRSIWHNDWVFAATEDAVLNPGDQLPVVIGSQPVLLLRNQAGELSAISNLCAHRGTILVEKPGNAKRIQCPYHAWTYSDGGRLLSVPYAERDDVDKAKHCLPVYRVEQWQGLVFVSLNPDVETVAERFAAVEPYFAEAAGGQVQHSSEYEDSQEWECNWKLAMLNAMESYHLFRVHPKTLEPTTPTKDAYYIAGSARATATGGKVVGGDDYLLISLPPGFVGVVNSGYFYWEAVHPIDTHRCIVRTGGGRAPSNASSTRSSLSRIFSKGGGFSSYFLPDFLPEDKAICERGQRGASGNFKPGPLLPVERVVADFGHYLNWRLNEVEPPPVYVEVPT